MGKVLRAILFANWALSLEERRRGALHGKGIPTLEEAPRGRQEWTWFAAGYRTEGKMAGWSSGRALQLKDGHFSDERDPRFTWPLRDVKSPWLPYPLSYDKPEVRNQPNAGNK